MTKDKRYHLIIISQALLITVLFHLLLLFGFSISSEPQTEETVAYRRISLLPTSGNSEMSPARLRPWLEYNDPTLIAKPNERYGYGHLLAVHGWRGSIDATGPEFRPRRPDFGSASAWNSNAELLWNQTSIIDWLSALSRVPVRKPVAAEINYPRIFNLLGNEILRGAFDDSMAETAAEIKRLPPVAPTVLHLNDGGAERLPRYQIRSSCGNRQLDQLALRVLMAHGNISGASMLTVAWPDLRGKTK